MIVFARDAPDTSCIPLHAVRLWIIMLNMLKPKSKSRPVAPMGSMLKPTPKSEAIQIIKKMKQAEKAAVHCIVV